MIISSIVVSFKCNPAALLQFLYLIAIASSTFPSSLYLSLKYEEENVVESIAIGCRNCNKDTGLYLKDTTIEEMITKFVWHTIFNHVGMSWKILSNNEMLYEIEENYHSCWFNKGPWYNTYICSKLHGELFKCFIKNARTERLI